MFLWAGNSLASGGVPGTTDCTLPHDGHCALQTDDWRFTVQLEDVGTQICGLKLIPSSDPLVEEALPFGKSIFAWAIGGTLSTRGPNLFNYKVNPSGYSVQVQTVPGQNHMTVTLGEGDVSGWTDFVKKSLFLSADARLDVYPVACSAAAATH
jgi:hypothetical protein